MNLYEFLQSNGARVPGWLGDPHRGLDELWAVVVGRATTCGITQEWIRSMADVLGVRSASREAHREMEKAWEAERTWAFERAYAGREMARTSGADWGMWYSHEFACLEGWERAHTKTEQTRQRLKLAEAKEPLAPLVLAALRAQGVE